MQPPQPAPPEPRPTPAPASSVELRAGDAEREQTADLLRAAAAEGRLDYDELDARLTAGYAARTRGELEALTADVPAGNEAAVPAAAGGLTSGRGTRLTLSVMGGHRRSGVWRVAKHSLVADVMGGSRIDLTEAEFADQVTTITVFSVMGGSRIVVPEGTRVEVSKLAIMGGHRVELEGEEPLSGDRVLRLRLFAVMGGSRVSRASADAITVGWSPESGLGRCARAQDDAITRRVAHQRPTAVGAFGGYAGALHALERRLERGFARQHHLVGS